MHDAHNHLQDTRFDAYREQIINDMRKAGIKRCVVNGTHPDNWPKVFELAHEHPDIITPSFGLHPWQKPTEKWLEELIKYLDTTPNASIGECGLDRWMNNHDSKLQEQVFLSQLQLATERNLPLSIHCLKAWGHLIELLESHSLPERGFLLHSYSGAAELIPRLTKLGAYFSFSGYFLHEKKNKVREAFQHIPPNRILIETDAPDMMPPSHTITHALPEKLNHPANLVAIHQHTSEFLDLSQIDQNFTTFFSTKS